MGGFNWFDAVAVVVVLISAARAYHEGFVKDIFGVVAFVAAIIVAFIFTPDATALLRKFVPMDAGWPAIAAAFVLFVVVYVAIKRLAGKLARSIDKSKTANAIDNGIGLVYGAARGILLMALVVLALKAVAGDPHKRGTVMPDAVAKAATYPFFDSIAKTVAAFLPKTRAGGLEV